MKATFNDPLAERIVDFLLEIGLEVELVSIDASTFLPGILISGGKIAVDGSKLTYPGDLLHEAGHLAVAASEDRSKLNGEVAVAGTQLETLEASAMAWSYAASLHLGLDPAVVFHDGGYGSDSSGLLFSFNAGLYIGLKPLQDAGLTAANMSNGSAVPPYPHMIKWLRD